MLLPFTRRVKWDGARRSARGFGLSTPTVRSKSIDGGTARFRCGSTPRRLYDGFTMFRLCSALQPDIDSVTSDRTMHSPVRREASTRGRLVIRHGRLQAQRLNGEVLSAEF